MHIRIHRTAALCWIAASSLLVAGVASAGSIFITGHDPIWHSGLGGNVAGATAIAQTGIEFARDGNAEKFLFIESKSAPVPSGNAFTAPFLTSALGYASGDFDQMEAADLLALADFRATLDDYSAIVIASDHGGMLTSGELSFLNAHAGDIIDYLNDGGGLYAEAESNATGNIGSTPRFSFFNFLGSSTDFQSGEVANTVTPFGASLGLTNSDVNGNFSHNFFSATGTLQPVDLFNGDPTMPLTLAFRGELVQEPEPGTLLLLGIGCSVLALRPRRSS
jgi:hypothetical protein